MASFATKQLGEAHDVLAPDTSEIRLLVGTTRGSLAHGTLAPDRVSLAIAHRTVEEVWYVTAGRGQVWRKQGGLELVVDVAPGTALTIPTGVHFQFRTIGPEPLCFVMCTMPGARSLAGSRGRLNLRRAHLYDWSVDPSQGA